jgi:hypothetical protein
VLKAPSWALRVALNLRNEEELIEPSRAKYDNKDEEKKDDGEVEVEVEEEEEEEDADADDDDNDDDESEERAASNKAEMIFCCFSLRSQSLEAEEGVDEGEEKEVEEEEEKEVEEEEQGAEEEEEGAETNFLNERRAQATAQYRSVTEL